MMTCRHLAGGDTDRNWSNDGNLLHGIHFWSSSQSSCLSCSRHHSPSHVPLWKLLPFWFAQYLGGFLAGLVNYIFWRSTILYFEETRAIVRDSCNGVQTAMMFGEYFPNPGDGWYISQNDIVPAWCDRDVTDQLTGHGGAFFVEMLGTAILMLVILSVTDKNNVFLGDSGLPPVLIGLTVSMLISFCAPLTQAVFNSYQNTFHFSTF
tara:strand:- start:141 stop:761 length:621 start_codon:yes stop_codon:yes gene_type:complete